MSMKLFAGRHFAAIAGSLAVAAITGCVLLAQSNAGQIQDIYNFTGGADGASQPGLSSKLLTGRLLEKHLDTGKVSTSLARCSRLTERALCKRCLHSPAMEVRVKTSSLGYSKRVTAISTEPLGEAQTIPFTGGADGSAPRTLIKASDGKFYGTSWGNDSPSAIFQFDPVTGTVVSYPFPSGLLGTSFPLLQALGGNFMDVTNTSGALPYGSVFSAALGLPPAGPSILGFRPASGGPGTLVTIWGSNFVGVTGVTVNGFPAKFRNTASGFVSFAVPQGASSDSVTVTTPGGAATSAGVFAVN